MCVTDVWLEVELEAEIGILCLVIFLVTSKLFQLYYLHCLKCTKDAVGVSTIA